MLESELFKKAGFVIKITGYKLESRDIFARVCKAFDCSKSADISIDEMRLRSFRNDYTRPEGINYEIGNQRSAEISQEYNRLGIEVVIVPHETGLEVFLVSVVTNILSSVLYDLFKKVVVEFQAGLERNRSAYKSQNEKVSEIIIIKKKYAVKVGIMEEDDTGHVKTTWYLSDKVIHNLVNATFRAQEFDSLPEECKSEIGSRKLAEEQVFDSYCAPPTDINPEQ